MLDYIHNNPIEAGFVSEPWHWKYCSAIDYDGGKGLIDIVRYKNSCVILCTGIFKILTNKCMCLSCSKEWLSGCYFPQEDKTFFNWLCSKTDTLKLIQWKTAHNISLRSHLKRKSTLGR